MGDAETDVEEKLIAAYGDELKADVLKVGHHGSATASSPAFLAKVRPWLAYIEVGYLNTFDFPAPSTSINLAAIGATPRLTYITRNEVYTIPAAPPGPGGTPPLPPLPPIPPSPVLPAR